MQGDTGRYRERHISKARALARLYLPLSPYLSLDLPRSLYISLHLCSQARALARLLLARRAASLRHGAADARYGVPVGGGEARAFASPLAELTARRGDAPSHWCEP